MGLLSLLLLRDFQFLQLRLRGPSRVGLRAGLDDLLQGQRAMAALKPAARARFMRDLTRLVAFNNGISRTPVGVR